jgi:hypothetical protein
MPFGLSAKPSRAANGRRDDALNRAPGPMPSALAYLADQIGT